MTIDEFVAKHGFPGTPAGDRMKADLELVVKPVKQAMAVSLILSDFAAAAELGNWGEKDRGGTVWGMVPIAGPMNIFSMADNEASLKEVSNGSDE